MKSKEIPKHKTMLAEYLYGDQLAKLKREYNRSIKQQKLLLEQEKEFYIKKIALEKELFLMQFEHETKLMMKYKEQEQFLSINRLFSNGISVSEIADCFNLTETDVLNIVKS